MCQTLIIFNAFTRLCIKWNNHQSDEKDCGDIQFWDKGYTFHKRRYEKYIDSCHKESEICAAYPEQRTVHFKKVANITINSDSVIPQEEKNVVRKIVRWFLMEKMRKKLYWGNCEQKIEQNMRKTFYLKVYLDNMLSEAKLLSTRFGRNNAKQIPISATDK